MSKVKGILYNTPSEVKAAIIAAQNKKWREKVLGLTTTERCLYPPKGMCGYCQRFKVEDEGPPWFGKCRYPENCPLRKLAEEGV
jgi:hypothetical protein